MTRIAFVLDQFELQSPGQQLLDRFLIGYNQNGEFKASKTKVILFLSGAGENRLIQSRVTKFGLEIADSMRGALAHADFAVVAPGTRKFSQSPGSEDTLVLSELPAGKAAYIDGSLLLSLESIGKARKVSDSRSISLSISRAAAHFVPLPIKPTFAAKDVQKTLIVAQGTFPEAELDALHALKPYLGSSWTQEQRPRVEALQNAALWDFAYSASWRPLLKAAISRSDNIKGDPDRDGRTQDIVGLQLLEKLAVNARGWRVQLANNKQLAILVLDNAVADFNFAVHEGGRIHSAQLYHPQAPMENHYDALAAWIDDHFQNRVERGNIPEAVFISGVLTEMPEARAMTSSR